MSLKDKIVDGEKVSPILPEEVKNYLIDIDGTICDDIPMKSQKEWQLQKCFLIQ